MQIILNDEEKQMAVDELAEASLIAAKAMAPLGISVLTFIVYHKSDNFADMSAVGYMNGNISSMTLMLDTLAKNLEPIPEEEQQQLAKELRELAKKYAGENNPIIEEGTATNAIH